MAEIPEESVYAVAVAISRSYGIGGDLYMVTDFYISRFHSRAFFDIPTR
jgi:hypothetical protein